MGARGAHNSWGRSHTLLVVEGGLGSTILLKISFSFWGRKTNLSVVGVVSAAE